MNGKDEGRPFDAANYLTTPEDVAEYLAVALEEGGDDPQYVAHALGVVARANANMTALARDTGISRKGLYKALSASGNPSFATILKVASSLGLAIRFEAVEQDAAKLVAV